MKRRELITLLGAPRQRGRSRRAQRHEVLVAAEHGRLRAFSGPDLSETHGLQRRRLSVRSDELVFENACVGASGGNTADQQIGAGRRAGRGDPCAGGSVERLEGGDLAKVGAVVVVERALQIE
jgi:hypothetical protein